MGMWGPCWSGINAHGTGERLLPALFGRLRVFGEQGRVRAALRDGARLRGLRLLLLTRRNVAGLADRVCLEFWIWSSLGFSCHRTMRLPGMRNMRPMGLRCDSLSRTACTA